MKCAVHSDVDAVGYCRNCGKAMCSVCVRPVRDVLYCEDCLASVMGIATPPPYIPPADVPASMPGASAYMPQATAGPRKSHPGLAFILGFCFPGLGAVYNGQYRKALLQIVIFAALIAGLSSGSGGGFEAGLGILLAGFIFYTAFDSMRVARERASGSLVAPDPLENWSKDRPIGPIILIAVGVILLLNNFDWFPWYRVGQFWPVLLIIIGVFMFRNRLGGRP